MRVARCGDGEGAWQWCEVADDGVWPLDCPTTAPLPMGAARRSGGPLASVQFGPAVATDGVFITRENFPGGPNPPPPVPRLFPKGARTLAAHGDDVVFPTQPARVIAEPEIAVVIGSVAQDVATDDVDAVVYGFTCLNDVTAIIDGEPFDFFSGKARATFSPCGPWIETDVGVADVLAGLRITCRVDGQVAVEGSTSDMIFDVRAVVAEASRVLALQPGDVISLGSPIPPPFVTPGQEVEIDIERVGVLRNRFVAP